MNKSQSVQRDHAVLSGPVYQDQRVQLASNTTVNETVPELNTRPLTEDELKELIKKNNVFEEEKNKKRQADWRQWEQDRHYGRFVPNSLSNSDPVKTITRAPSPSWREQMLWRQKHPRRYSSYDKKRRIYYYPEVIRVTSDFVLPTEFTPVSVSGKTYYYSDGNFYERQDRTFTSTAPPLGALVTTLPGGAAAVTIAGMPLHTFNGVYYKKKTAGYEVVPPPDSFDGVLIETASLTVNGEEAITVSLPDPEMPDRLVEIKLVRFGDKGFRGPQGESYSEFPSIEQLREMYL